MASSASRTAAPPVVGTAGGASFEVYVSKDTFKFNAAHFVAFENYRERLHGHNYRVGVRLLGQRQLGADGYLIDFGNVKKVTKQICKRLNEHFLCPMHSNVLDIVVDDQQQVRIVCRVDGAVFSFPRTDCALLPIVHATTEEIAIYLWAEILNGLQADYLIQRQIHTMEVTVAEAPGQEATFRLEIPKTRSSTDSKEAGSNNNDLFQLDVRSFISTGDVVPMPCLKQRDSSTDAAGENKKTGARVGCCCCGPNGCHQTSKLELSDKLDQLAQAINNGGLERNGGTGSSVTAKDLQDLLDSTASSSY